MAREIKKNEADNHEDNLFNDKDRLEGFAASEMADRGPKGMSSFTGEDDGTETRPVTHMYAEPGGAPGDEDDVDDDDDEFDEDDDLDIDDDVDDDDDLEIDDPADDDLDDDDLDDDLTLDDDEDEDDDLR